VLSEEHKSKINNLWNLFRSANISNPLTILENISYLMLLKQVEVEYEQRGQNRSKRNQTAAPLLKKAYRWSTLIEMPPLERLKHFKENVFPFLTKSRINGPAFPVAMKGAVFGVSKPTIFADAVNLVDELLSNSTQEQRGDIYESLLTELQLSGKQDQFRTPRHLIRTIIELVEVTLGDWVCDPAAGTGGFLIGAYQWILKEHTPPQSVTVDPEGFWRNLTGDMLPTHSSKRALVEGPHFSAFDIDATMTRIGLTNMLLHGIRRPAYRCLDMLKMPATPPRQFELVLSDLPKSSSQEAQFVRRCRSLLKKGGRASFIVSEEFLFNEAEDFRLLRKELIESHDLEAVVSLPSGVFMPYSSSKTAVLILNRGQASEAVNFYEVTGDGFTLDDKRLPDPEKNDLRFVPLAHRILAKGNPKQEHWDSTEAQNFFAQQCSRVERQDFSRQNYSLVRSVYLQPLTEAGSLQSPRQLVSQIRRLQEQFGKSLDKIEKLMKEVAGA
jgi:type I restriction enzyme M protein